MGKQEFAGQGHTNQVRTNQAHSWIVKWIVGFVLAVAIVGAPLMASDSLGPLADLLVHKAYACPHQGGGSC